MALMRSPFPGMDPYLERHWLDVHTKLVAYAADALNEQLPADLVASTEERVAVEAEPGGEHVFAPDVFVSESTAQAVTGAGSSTGVLEAPFRLVAQVEPVTERFVRIVEAGGERLITVIEFVSPTKKRGEGLLAFRNKRAELLASGVNFVEVDLLRSGDWAGLLRPHRFAETVPTSAFRVAIRVPRDPHAVYFFPIGLRVPLPSIPIPLRARDPEVRLDLQSLVTRAYENGRYARRLDYAKPCDPPLDAGDAAWAAALTNGKSRS